MIKSKNSRVERRRKNSPEAFLSYFTKCTTCKNKNLKLTQFFFFQRIFKSVYIMLKHLFLNANWTAFMSSRLQNVSSVSASELLWLKKMSVACFNLFTYCILLITDYCCCRKLQCAFSFFLMNIISYSSTYSWGQGNWGEPLGVILHYCLCINKPAWRNTTSVRYHIRSQWWRDPKLTRAAFA